MEHQDTKLTSMCPRQKELNDNPYLNDGSKKKPHFTGKYFYALDTKGDTISSKQWCCIGMHPRMVDITGDGRIDMLSGEYNPGRVGLWQGCDKGFLPLQYVEQEGYKAPPYRSMDNTSPESNNYWNYTSAGFGDYNGDGLLDLFVGGTAGLRVALNEGTKEKPRFGLRQYLRFTDNTILTTGSDETMSEGMQPKYIKTYMTPVDWDGDGVLDLLVTNEYSNEVHYAVQFYRGVRTNLGLRFERPVPLFTSTDGTKALPGCQPMINVADLNGDGVNDIVMGLSIPTIASVADPLSSQRTVADSLVWMWIHDLGIEMPGKDAGEFYMHSTFDKMLERIKDEKDFEKAYYLGKLNDPKYLTLRHRGFVLVFYGKKNKQKVEAVSPITLEMPKPKPTAAFADGDANEPMTYRVECIKRNGTYQLSVFLKFKDGWHGYADKPATQAQGMLPTKVEIIPPKGLACNGALCTPYIGDGTMYFGEQKFMQYLFRNSRSNEPMIVKIKVSYQACDDTMCLPPIEHTIDYEIKD